MKCKLAFFLLLAIYVSSCEKDSTINKADNQSPKKGIDVDHSVYRDKTGPTGKVEYEFVSSESNSKLKSTQGVYIQDFDFVASNSSSIKTTLTTAVAFEHSSYAPDNYILVDKDLNEGAGGKYIYLIYRRGDDANQAIKGIEARAGKALAVPPAYYLPPDNDLVITRNFNSSLYEGPAMDLNDGAGGDYIWVYKSWDSKRGGPFKEIGVISGNSSSIQPPAGWVKLNLDMNRGAGGKYIYICGKR